MTGPARLRYSPARLILDMSNLVIRCEGLGKRFRLGSDAAPDRFSEFLANFGRKADGGTGRPRDLWALRDVAFEVAAGEVVGIVGRNGSGKSTLLKILSRITRPTTGRAEIVGRVGSLLEAGTGFHHELTGRENVYLNGAILGMTRREIRGKFDEIVAFAEMEPFLDTPVKRYSTGMTVRLAFAVAAHLEPEVLIVDEVLAVGDVNFQKKCLRKMGEASRLGHTVLIVSHNLPSIVNLCDRALLLESGRLVGQGTAEAVVREFLARNRSSPGEALWPDPATAPGDETVRLHAVRVLQDGLAGPVGDIDISRELTIEIAYWTQQAQSNHFAGFQLRDQVGTVVLSTATATGMSRSPDAWYGRPQPAGLYISHCRLPANYLNDTSYTITPIIHRAGWTTAVLVENAVEFHVHDTGQMRQEFTGIWPGSVRPQLDWSTDLIEPS